MQYSCYGGVAINHCITAQPAADFFATWAVPACITVQPAADLFV